MLLSRTRCRLQARTFGFLTNQESPSARESRRYTILNLTLFSLYSLFAVTTIAAVFGSAVAVTSSYLLFLCSLFVVWKYRWEFRLILIEKIILALVMWLLCASVLRDNAVAGMVFVIEEYRLLWMVPFISFAMARVLSESQIWAPLVMGSVFNVIGSGFLYFAKAVKVPLALDVTAWLGVEPSGKGSRFSLNGKFVQAWFMTLWSGLSFAWLSWKPSVRTYFLGILLVALIGFMLYHGVMYADARTGFFSSLATLGALCLVLTVYLEKRTKRALAAAIILLAFIGGVLLISNPPQRIEVGVANAVKFFQSGVEATSIGLRLVVWRELSSLNFDQWLVGVGAGNWQSTMEAWFPDGHLGRRFVKWNDYHSQLIWLIVKGGVVALLLYIALAAAILLKSIDLLIREHAFALGGFGIGIVGVLVLAGGFNSVFTALREAHVTGLALMAWIALVRMRTSTADNNT